MRRLRRVRQARRKHPRENEAERGSYAAADNKTSRLLDFYSFLKEGVGVGGWAGGQVTSPWALKSPVSFKLGWDSEGHEKIRQAGSEGGQKKTSKKELWIVHFKFIFILFYFKKKRVLKPPTTKKRKRQNKMEGFTWNRWTFRLMQKKIVFKWRQKEKMFEHRQKKKRQKTDVKRTSASVSPPRDRRRWSATAGHLLLTGVFFLCVFLSKGEGAGGWQMSATLVYLHRTTIISVCSSLNWNAFGFYSEREGFHILLNLNRHYKGF